MFFTLDIYESAEGWTTVNKLDNYADAKEAYDKISRTNHPNHSQVRIQKEGKLYDRKPLSGKPFELAFFLESQKKEDSKDDNWEKIDNFNLFEEAYQAFLTAKAEQEEFNFRITNEQAQVFEI
ncbi:MAG: hypothetical protein JJT94_09430 [Bernardetiaceae bacterium]|nr:hypothetical protein [Bernardetiaceae bacterium]